MFDLAKTHYYDIVFRLHVKLFEDRLNGESQEIQYRGGAVVQAPY